MVQRLLCIRFGEILLDAKCLQPILLCHNCHRDFGELPEFCKHLSYCLRDEGLLRPNAELEFHGNSMVKEYCNKDTKKNLVVYNVNNVTVKKEIDDNIPLVDLVKIEAEMQDPKWFTGDGSATDEHAHKSPASAVANAKVSTRQSTKLLTQQQQQEQQQQQQHGPSQSAAKKRTASPQVATDEPPAKRSLVSRNSIATAKVQTQPPASAGDMFQRKSLRQRSTLVSAQQNIKDPPKEHEFVVPKAPQIRQNAKKTEARASCSGGGTGGAAQNAKTSPRVVQIGTVAPKGAKPKELQTPQQLQQYRRSQQQQQLIQIQKSKALQQQLAMQKAKKSQPQKVQILNIQQQPAKVQQQSAKVHQQPAKVQQQSAKVHQQPAKVQQQSAKAQQQSAKVQQQPPKVQQQSAKAKQQPSKAQQQKQPLQVEQQQQPSKVQHQPPKQQETENILKKLHNLGLEVKRTQPPAITQSDALLNAKNTHTVEILNKLKAKGMQVKVLNRNNNNNNDNHNSNSISTKESSRESLKMGISQKMEQQKPAILQGNLNPNVTIRKLTDIL